MAETAGVKSKRKTAFRFKVSSDVELLKEVIHIQPFAASYGQTKARWEDVGVNMCKLYGDAIMDTGWRVRFDDLLSALRKATTASLRAYGTEEEYEVQDQLLQNIYDLIENSMNAKEASKSEKLANSTSVKVMEKKFAMPQWED
ncbi:hypothetical protein AC1031_001672 [Aphanomyces cochlioides]|nr:hypothetical protein AC1031_001672 [Aphanomyces cochlioides]